MTQHHATLTIVSSLQAAALCHELGGKKLTCIGIDGGATLPCPVSKLVGTEFQFSDLDTHRLKTFDLGIGARLPRFNVLRLGIGTDFEEAVEVFCGRPEHPDSRFLHGSILSVVVRTNTVAGRGEVASLSPEGRSQ